MVDFVLMHCVAAQKLPAFCPQPCWAGKPAMQKRDTEMPESMVLPGIRIAGNDIEMIRQGP